MTAPWIKFGDNEMNMITSLIFGIVLYLPLTQKARRVGSGDMESSPNARKTGMLPQASDHSVRQSLWEAVRAFPGLSYDRPTERL